MFIILIDCSEQLIRMMNIDTEFEDYPLGLSFKTVFFCYDVHQILFWVRSTGPLGQKRKKKEKKRERKKKEKLRSMKRNE